MEDSFKGKEQINLWEASENNRYGFSFQPPATTTQKASIPFGTNITTATVSATDENGDTVNDLITNSNVSENIVSCSLSFPAAGVGIYYLKFILELDDGSVWVKSFKRIYAEEIL